MPALPTNRGKKLRRACAFTFVEVMMAAVIMSVLLVAALKLFGNLGRSRGDVLMKDKANTLVIELIQEILQKSYSDPVDSAEFGPGADEIGGGRPDFDDMDDYHDLIESPPQDAMGNTISGYSNMSRQVAVRHVDATDFSLSAASDQGYKEVTITVKAGGEMILQKQYVIADAPMEITTP